MLARSYCTRRPYTQTGVQALNLDREPKWKQRAALLFYVLFTLCFNPTATDMSLGRPRRVFSRRFVMLCGVVVVLELVILNQLFGQHG